MENYVPKLPAPPFKEVNNKTNNVFIVLAETLFSILLLYTAVQRGCQGKEKGGALVSILLGY